MPLEGAPLDDFRQFEWYQVICLNSPEGFLPKKLNFTMQAVQVLWFHPKRKDSLALLLLLLTKNLHGRL